MQLSELTGVSKEIQSYDPDHSLPMPTDLIGIEVELELIPQMSLPLWNVVHDGSLRDGCEYVLREPLYGTGITEALDILQTHLNEYNPRISERCSVHVHINVSDMEVQDFQKFLAMYVIFERVLFRYHGDRANNVFCIPWYKAGVPLEHLLSLETKQRSSHWEFMDCDKYSALNILPINNFGSIEFRHMAGTTDTSKILEWIRIIMHLKKFAMSLGDLQELPAYLSGTGGRRFLREVFGTDADVLTYRDVDQDILKGVRAAQRAIFANRFTERVQDVQENIPPPIAPRTAGARRTATFNNTAWTQLYNTAEIAAPATITITDELEDVRRTLQDDELFEHYLSTLNTRTGE